MGKLSGRRDLTCLLPDPPLGGREGTVFLLGTPGEQELESLGHTEDRDDRFSFLDIPDHCMSRKS